MSLTVDQTARLLPAWQHELPEYPPCNAPLESLQKMSLRDLFEASKKAGANEIYRGRYLLVRTTSSPYWAMDHRRPQCEIEDEHGTRCILRLKSSTLFDENWRTYIVIKEPPKLVILPQPDMFGLKYVFLPVMHRSDWDMIYSTSDLIPKSWQENYWQGKTRLELKEQGNELYKAKRWWGAIERYTQAMARPSMRSVPTDMLLRNRAIAARCGGLLDVAFNDSNEAIRLDSKNPKNLLQLARTYYMARDFEATVEQLQRLLALDRRNAEGKALLHQCRKRIHEAKTGEYPFLEMDKEFRSNSKPYFDAAEYIGPVEVKTTEEFGRGLYATKDVKAGELLIVSKAMSFIYYGPELPEDGHGIEASARVTLDLFAKLHASKDFRKKYFTLFRIKKGNESLHAAEEYNLLDFGVVSEIQRSNSISAGCLDWDTGSFKGYASGLWGFPSFLNHSCCFNCYSCNLGDLLILRATEDIPAGEQLFISYAGIGKSYRERCERLSEDFGFVCKCRLCAIECRQSPAILAKREGLVKQMENFPILRLQGSGWEAKLEAILAEAEKTYELPSSQHPRIELATEYLKIGLSYGNDQKRKGAINVFMKVLRASGFVFDEEDRVVKYGFVGAAALTAAMQLSTQWHGTPRFVTWLNLTMTISAILTGYKNIEGAS